MFLNQKGQTLIEALIALGISITIIAAISSVVITSLSGANYTIAQNQAGSYAQQGMEFVRREVVSDFNGFIGTYKGKYYCLGSDLTLSPKDISCADKNIGKFTREVDIFLNDSSCNGNLRADVKVAWTDNKCKDSSNLYCHSANLTSCFSDPNALPTGT